MLNAQSQGQCCRAESPDLSDERPELSLTHRDIPLVPGFMLEGNVTRLPFQCASNMMKGRTLRFCTFAWPTSVEWHPNEKQKAPGAVCASLCVLAHKKRQCVTRTIFQCHYIVNANLQRLTCSSIYNDALHIIVQENNTWLSRQLFVMCLVHVIFSSMACPLRHAAESQRQPPACLLKLIKFRVNVKPFSKCFCKSDWFLPWNAELAKELGVD